MTNSFSENFCLIISLLDFRLIDGFAFQECGPVATWKRIQGSNGKFQAFGFCEFDNPYGTMRALRVLHDFPLGDKKLVVKVCFYIDMFRYSSKGFAFITPRI